MWARLYGPDAAVVEQRVEQMMGSVCEDDPRTLGERRSEALPAIAAGFNALACQCGRTDCAAAARDVTPPATAVVHVVAEAATVEAARTETVWGYTAGHRARLRRRRRRAAARLLPRASCRAHRVPPTFCAPPAAENTALSPADCPAPPAFVIGGGVMPAPLLAATLERATVREIRHPGDAPPEPQLSPVAGTGRFRAVPGSDLSVARLRQTRLRLRPRPHRALPDRADACLEPQVLLPFSPPAENFLVRGGRLARAATARRHPHLGLTDGPRLHHQTR